jgi:hypothetical protein
VLNTVLAEVSGTDYVNPFPAHAAFNAVIINRRCSAIPPVSGANTSEGPSSIRELSFLQGSSLDIQGTRYKGEHFFYDKLLILCVYSNDCV